jgi:UDP-N-acetylmuramate dehydrogenase
VFLKSSVPRMTIEHNISLKPHNTFGVDVRAKALVRVATLDDLRTALVAGHDFKRVLVLGGGSNLLLTHNVEGLVIKIELRGMEIVLQSLSTLDVECAAGEVWDDIVQKAVAQNWGGIENLSLIPGSIGAAPVQNIGAYGVELKDVLVSVQGMMRDTGEMRTITRQECAFGYRDSIFKRELHDKFVITSVTMRLCKNPTAADLNTQYGAIQQEIVSVRQNATPQNYTLNEVSEAVRRIRASKLPSPALLGNAGSFFKNPEVPYHVYERIHTQFPTAPVFMLDSGLVKIPAGWLIEQCGWKGKRVGDAGMHSRQALVLVNYGNATGQDLVRIADDVRASVQEKFGIRLETEVNIL